MGAANAIPGVSGGTIAFLTGIYEELVKAISSINMTAVKLFFTGKFREFWAHIHGNFLLAVFVGMVVSVVSLAKLMTYLLKYQPIPTWAFFFGLIVASSIFILKEIHGWKFKDVLLLVAGVVVGVVICTLTPMQTPDAIWFIFLSGAIAICSMILPGISGSFILLILGKYEFLLQTLANVTSGAATATDVLVLVVWIVGAVVGILAFSKFIDWLLTKYYRGTLLFLAGFIIGSLVKVWPWNNMETIVLSQFPEAEVMIAGGENADKVVSLFAPQTNPHIAGAIIFALVGFALVAGIELASTAIKKSRVH